MSPLLALAVPVSVALVVGVLAPTLARRVHPATATWSLSLSALGTALATLISVGAVVVSGLLRVTRDRPLPAVVHDVPPGRLAIALLLAAPVVVGVSATGRFSLMAVSDWFAVRAAWAGVHPVDGVHVVDAPGVEAYAVPARRGLVIVHTGMLHLLDESERAVVLAHERAHLRRHHHLHILLVRACVCVNPLLHTLSRLSSEQVERWADEDAAVAVGSRPVVARTVARAALARSDGGRRGPSGLGVSSGDAVARTSALLRPAPPQRRALLCAALVIAVGLPVLAVAQADAVEDHYEHVRVLPVGHVDRVR
jgi:Zn-dependent protease with chaperone function